MNEKKEIRQKFGLTHKRFSEITGIPKRTIENWKGGQRTPPDWLPKMIRCYLEMEQTKIELSD